MGPRGSVFGTVACILPWILVALAAALGGEARAGEPTAPTLLVRADGTGDHATIQEAIDAAVPGAEILVGEGTFEGHLRITKPLSIRGAGFGSTHVTSLLFKRCDLNAVNRSMMPRLRQARTEAERQAVWVRIRAMRKALVRPTILVEDTEGVRLDGLRLSGRADREEGVVNPGEVVAFRRAKGTVANCAVLGSPGRGIAIQDGSEVTVRGCLVAAVWATGIEVGADGSAPVKARILGNDIRRCVHRGLTIAPQCNEVLVEQNRIALSAWHGIRYDDASPTIRRNVIMGHAKSGIYASGETHATVEANLVVGNAGEGMSCWFQNADTIHGNTFANNDAVSIGLAGGSRPVVEQNVFYRSFVAVDGLHLARDEDGDATASAPYPIRKNVWFKCARLTRAVRRGAMVEDEAYEDLPLAKNADNEQRDPGFANAAALDFALPPTSRAGVRDPLETKSPWPVQPEEKTMKEAWGDGCAAAGH